MYILTRFLLTTQLNLGTLHGQTASEKELYTNRELRADPSSKQLFKLLKDIIYEREESLKELETANLAASTGLQKSQFEAEK